MNQIQVVIGQRIHCILYGGDDGIIFRIHGEQSPESIGTMAGVVSYGGRAHFDIVFSRGTISRMVPECIVRGVQWRIYDKVATPEEIASAIHHAEQTEARRETERQNAEDRRAREREEHKANYPHLTKRTDKPDYSPGRLAAENIRKELKREFPGVKFTVRSDFNSVRIGWTDGPTSDQVEEVCGKYQAGHFDGMEDIYRNNPDATFADVFGDPKYVFVNRGETLEGVKRAWQLAGYDPQEVPADWMQGSRWKLPNDRGQHIFDKWSQTDLRNEGSAGA